MQLQSLDLSSNQITTLPLPQFMHNINLFSNLEILNLAENRLMQLPLGLKLNKLKTLNLKGNLFKSIKNLESITELKSLKTLYIGNNQITAIDELKSNSIQIIFAENCCKS